MAARVFENEAGMPAEWESNTILERDANGHFMIVDVPDDMEEGDSDAGDD